LVNDAEDRGKGQIIKEQSDEIEKLRYALQVVSELSKKAQDAVVREARRDFGN
jgi:hypothetical protein